MKKTKETKGGTTATAAAAAAVMLPVSELVVCPLNPRMAPSDVSELAKSIREHGVLTPLLVRPGTHGYEVVCGSRRLKAADLAGLDSVPCVVRDIADGEAAEIGLLEQLQREELTPLDESDAYQKLVNDHGLTTADVAAKVGRSDRHVLSRLALSALAVEGRSALLAERLNLGQALEIARLPEKKDQVRALAWVDKLEPQSVEMLRRHIEMNYMRRLEDAPFPTMDAKLCPARGSCSRCLKRTSAEPLLFEDMTDSDRCMDMECWNAKMLAESGRKLRHAKNAGLEVLSEEDAKKVCIGGVVRSREFEDLDVGFADARTGDDYDLNKDRTLRELLGDHAPEIVLAVDDTGRAHEMVRSKDLKDALKAAGVKLANWSCYSDDVQEDEAKAEIRRKREEAAEAERAEEEKRIDALVKKAREMADEEFYPALVLTLMSWGMTESLCEKLGLEEESPKAAMVKKLLCRSMIDRRETMTMAILADAWRSKDLAVALGLEAEETDEEDED